MELIDKVIEVVAQTMGLDESVVGEESTFLKLGADSLDLMEIAEGLEEHYKIDFTTENLECKTVSDLVNAVGEAIDDEL